MGFQSPVLWHRQQPQILMQQIAVTLITAVPGDFAGELPLLGGNRTSQTDSDGRGLLEVEEEVLAAVNDLNALEGVTVRMTGQSLPEPMEVEGLGYALARSYGFEASATSMREYPAPTQLVATAAGGG